MTFFEENVMAGSGKPRTTRSGQATEAAKQRAKAAPSERPFDMWLQKQLHAMYDEIASEPLPDDLLDLIDDDAVKSADGKVAPDGKKP